MDIKGINIPDLSFIPSGKKEQVYEESDVYVYATWAKPGHHQIMIYDPMLNKAFCKDFMINLNFRESIFPEFPILEGMDMQRKIRNVFELWEEETLENVNKGWEYDLRRSGNFSIEHLTRDVNDRIATLNKLKVLYDKCKVYQKVLMLNSTDYPYVNYDSICNLLELMHQNYPKKFKKHTKSKLTHEKIELCYIQCSRKYSEQGT